MAAEFLVRMGARIEQKRKERGLSRADLARQLPGKVSENQLYRWERGKHQPNPDTLQAIAAALGCDVAELMAPAPVKAVTPSPLPEGRDGVAAQLAALTRAVSEMSAQLADIQAAQGEAAATAAEVMRLLDDRLPPSVATPRRRRA